LSITSADSSNNFYVANDGSDSNDGLSPANPWKTIGKVNSELNGGVISIGDDIFFKRGDLFNDAQLGLRTGGTLSNPMVFGAYGTGNKPIFDYSSASVIYFNYNGVTNITLENLNITGGGTAAINFDGAATSNIKFINLESYNVGHSLALVNVDYYTIENCHFQPNNPYGHGLSIGTGSSNGIIRNVTCHNCKDGVNLHFGGTEDDSVGDNHWIENVTCYNTSEEGFDIVGGTYCDNVYLKNCEAYDNGQGIVVSNGQSNVVIDNCYVHDQPVNGIVVSKCKNTIIRNTVVQNWSSSKNGIVKSSTDFTYNTVIYNNNIISDGCPDSIQLNNKNIDGFIVKNNIFYSTDYDNGVYVNAGSSNFTSINSNWTYNLWWRDDGLTGYHWGDDDGALNWTKWNARAEVNNELRQDPLFVDDTSDFSLQSGSPCIDAGGWLTTCNGGGTGNTVTVDEANYFFDGYGLTSGDNIFIGDDKDLEVKDVDYSAETITVNRSITWANGEDVSLSSYGSYAPDIGARESLFIGPKTIFITNIERTTSDPLDTDVSFGWINITATLTSESEISNVMLKVDCPNSSSYNVSMNLIEDTTYYYNTSTIFSTPGGFNYCIWTNDINGNQSTSNVYYFSMPPNWDINKDGTCNILDLILVSNHYNETGQDGWIREDVDNNGLVKLEDLMKVIEHYYETW
jgi:hypothetical protein